MKYELIESYRAEEFEVKVNKALKAGANLVGGVAIASTRSGDTRYTQAVLKPE